MKRYEEHLFIIENNLSYAISASPAWKHMEPAQEEAGRSYESF